MLFLRLSKQSWWYNTILCFPTGVFVAYNKKQITTLFRKHYWLILGLLLLFFCTLHFSHFPALGGVTYNIKSILFCFIIVLVTMKFRVGNRWLYWLGNGLFPLYVFQRLPMIAFFEGTKGSFVYGHPALFLILSFIVTVLITLLYLYFSASFSLKNS